MNDASPFALVFLAGGVGTRMKSSTPKQYLKIHEKPLSLYSFDIFLSMPEMIEAVVVCEPFYEELFHQAAEAKKILIRFASPGPRRQDSVFNGIASLSGDPLVCIHDSARPMIEASIVRQVASAADRFEAAVLGVKARSTFKMSDGNQNVLKTIERDSLWEIQTPQIIRLSLLKQGFSFANENHLTVTDDVSLVELLGKPVKIVEGSYSNIKVTTPEDLVFVEKMIDRHALLQTHHSL